MINIEVELKPKPFLKIKEKGFSFGKFNTGVSF